MLVALAQGVASASPNAFVPADHWTYTALYRLAARGLAPLWTTSARPLPRLELARMVADALERAAQRETTPMSEGVRADLAALRDEFADELRALAAARAGQPLPAAVAVGVAGTARLLDGAPPRFVRHTGGGVELTRLSLAGRFGDVAAWAGHEPLWWGPGYRGAFLLSENTGSLTSLTVTLASGPLRVTKLIAPLSAPGVLPAPPVPSMLTSPGPLALLATPAPSERYLYGLRVDWLARDDLRVGFGEVMVGVGGLSPLYALNVVPGLAYAIALRVRAPTYDDNYNFTLDVEWRPRPGIVVYAEAYVDDLVGPGNPFPHRLGGTAGLFLADPFADGRTSVRFEHSRATNWIYATPNPAGAYIRDGRALGHWCAPDCELWSVAVVRALSPAASLTVGYDLIRKGEGVLGQTWTDPDDARRRYYLSGVVETTHALRVVAIWTHRLSHRPPAGFGVASPSGLLPAHLAGTTDLSLPGNVGSGDVRATAAAWSSGEPRLPGPRAAPRLASTGQMASMPAGELRLAATAVWSSTSNAEHVAGATRQGWFFLMEAAYGF
ncbi:MAG: capsule assembly Wzi family protein [Armatimonadota bacterium]|nr:capsule assembly Wzi family protein [Armatimonadota bacterium]